METVNEMVARAASESAARIRAADQESRLSAEAFAFGVFDKYYTAKMNEIMAEVEDVDRRIDEQFGNAGAFSN